MALLRRILVLAVAVTIATAPLSAGVCAVKCVEPSQAAVQAPPSSHCDGMAGEGHGYAAPKVGDSCRCSTDITPAPALKPGNLPWRSAPAACLPGVDLGTPPVQIADQAVSFHSPPVPLRIAIGTPLRI
jgi:hypothetical protein